MFPFPLMVSTPSVKSQLRLPLVPLSAKSVPAPAKSARMNVKNFFICFCCFFRSKPLLLQRYCFFVIYARKKRKKRFLGAFFHLTGL